MNASRSEDVLTHVLLASPYAIIVIEQDGVIVEWNPQAEILFGYTREEALGNSIDQLVIPEQLRSHHIGGIDNFLKTGKSHVLGKRLQVSGMRKSGDEFPAELSVTMGSGGKYFAAFVRDLTGVQQTERLLIENQQRLAHVTRLNTLSELASGIAHEMNQPLTAIANVAASGLMSEDVDEACENLRKIEKYVHLAGQLVGRFRSLASESVNKHEFASINTQVEEIVGLLHNQLYHQSITLETNLDSNAIQVPMDRIQIQQVLVNLVQNAIDALAHCVSKLISIETRDSESELLIIITNGGPKLVDEHVFDSFYTTKKEGMGLGLSISRTIIQNHGGRIWLDREHKHTCFCLTLPKDPHE